MKKLLTLFLLILSSCSTKNENAFMILKDLSKKGTYYSINANQILGKVDNENFILYFGTDFCPKCNEIKNYLNSYIERKNTMIYRFDNSKGDYLSLNLKFPQYFSSSFITPSLYIFHESKGLLYFTDDYSRLEGKSLEKLLDAYSLDNSFSFFNNEEGHKAFISQNEGLIFTYDSAISQNTKILKDHIFKKITNRKVNFALLDINYLDNNFVSYFTSFYKIPNINNIIFNIKKDNFVSYLNNLNEMDNLINEYLKV